jgi:hypothetical protein
MLSLHAPSDPNKPGYGLVLAVLFSLLAWAALVLAIVLL